VVRKLSISRSDSPPITNSPAVLREGHTRIRRKGWGGFFSGLAAASFFIPIHPSVQGLLHQLGIKTAILFLILWFPVLFHMVYNGFIRRKECFSIFPFVGYSLWLVASSLYSPGLGLENWVDSIRGVALILPCVMVAALSVAREPKSAAKVAIICGLSTLLHYSLLLLTGQSGGESNAGFGAVATIDGVQKYQETSFYMGFFGVYLLAAYSSGRLRLWTGVTGIVIVLYLMGTVGARASVIGLLFVLLIFFTSFRLKKVAVGLFFVGFLALIMSAVFLLSTKGIDIEKITAALPVFERFSTLTEDGDSSHRVRLFLSAISLWLDSPATFFFGGGLGSFPVFTGQTNENGWYPHNFILETLAEGGLVALLFLISPALVLLKRHALVHDRTHFEKNLFYYAALYSLVSFMFMGGLSTIWIPFFPWIVFILMTKKHDSKVPT
jgi:hypothetical protein